MKTTTPIATPSILGGVTITDELKQRSAAVQRVRSLDEEKHDV